jgi:hypothetical protein
MTSELISDVLDVLERHGYHRCDRRNTGEAIAAIYDLAYLYDGTRDASSGTHTLSAPCAEPGPSAPQVDDAVLLTHAEVSTVFAALQIAADDQRDRAEMCADCADETCPACETRLCNAQAYEQMSDELLQTAEAARTASSYQPDPGGAPGPLAQPYPSADKEAGQ